MTTLDDDESGILGWFLFGALLAMVGLVIYLAVDAAVSAPAGPCPDGTRAISSVVNEAGRVVTTCQGKVTQ